MAGTMRLLASLAVLAVVAAAACSPPQGESPGLERTVFTVTGMHCDNCNAAIAGTLQGMAGVVEASADYTKGEAVAVYRPEQVSVGSLEATIEKLGYTVTAMTTAAVETTSL